MLQANNELVRVGINKYDICAGPINELNKKLPSLYNRSKKLYGRSNVKNESNYCLDGKCYPSYTGNTDDDSVYS